ncbi:MAG: nicotinate-nucleotide adenylyltransferase [Bacteroidales bacterium]|jgi:nicotinate-nucleotide adenylyltransferase|nr:nicotinate-nucleotide adenylyltransferase [Bacteroidales bacterium]
MKVGLFFGSFNPIHIGHLIIAEYCLEHSDLCEIWFVVSPCNPLKKKATLLAEHHRLYMTKLAIENDFRFRACNIEFKLPYPSYTATTLMRLSEKYPDKEFALILGDDNMENIEKWRNWEYILDNYNVIVYPRYGFDQAAAAKYPHVSYVNAPLMELSATQIRENIKAGRQVRYMLPDTVWHYIDEMGFYKK